MLKKKLGNWAEDVAVNYLLAQGYSIVRRNFRYRRAEVDIIASYQNELVIVEVKYRKKLDTPFTQRVVSERQIRNLIAAANGFVLANKLDQPVRFDIIYVFAELNHHQIRHEHNAFSFI